MKHLTLTLFFLISIINLSFSQQFTDAGNQWTVSQFDVWNGHTSSSIYKATADTTIINGLTYTNFYSYTDTIPNAASEGPFLFRQDSTKKVYSYAANEEKLLYDFNLSIGDTMYFGVSQPLWVISIDSVQISSGEWRKRWQFTCEFNNSDPYIAEVVDGIGSVQGGLFDYYYSCYPDYDLSFRCFSVNEEVQYPTGISENYQCFYNFVDVKEVQTEFKTTPNPATDFINITASNNDFQLESVQIFNLSGQFVFEQKIISDDSSIYINSLPDGLYFIKMKTKKGELFSSRFVKG